MAITTITKSIAWLAKAGVLVWATVRPVDGSGDTLQRQYAAEVIPDPSTYAGGPKPAQVQKWGTNVRQASDIKGRNEAATMTIILSDASGEIRGWFEDPTLRNIFGVEASIDLRLTTDRGNSILPAPNWHGLIRKPSGQPGGKIQLEAWDLIAALEQQGPQDTFFPVAADFPSAPASSLSAYGQRWYGKPSDEPSDAVTGAPTLVAESASGAMTGGSAATNYGVVPTGAALAGFGSLAGVLPAPASFTPVEAPQGSGSPGNAFGPALNSEAAFHFQRWAYDASNNEGDPIPFLPFDPAGKLVFVSDPSEADFTGASVPGASGYRTSSGQLYDGPPKGYKWQQTLDSGAATTAVMNQTPHDNVDLGSVDPLTLAAGAIVAAGPAQNVYGLTWQTATGESAMSGLWIARPSPYRRPIRGTVTAPPGSAVNAWLYKAALTSDGSVPTFTQRKLIPLTNLNGSGDLFWEDDLLGTGWVAVSGTSGGGITTTKGMIPTIEGGGARTDALGMTWPSCLILAAGAVKSAADGTLTAYSRDSSGNVTPLASVINSQISIPGQTGYAARWGSAPYVTINGRRWTICPIAGQLATDVASGKVTVWFNGGGVESVGDGSGTRLDSPVDQLAHLFDNDAGPLALGGPSYIGGNWASAPPTFGDGRAARNATNFAAAKAFLAAILTTGDSGSWIVPQGRTWADIIAQIAAIDCDCAIFPDENGALCLMPEAPNPNATVRTDLPVTETSEIAKLSAAWEDETTSDYYYNTLTYTFAPTFDAAGASTNQQKVLLPYAFGRSTMRGRVRVCSETLEFLARRDANACFTIATRYLQRAAPAPRNAGLKTSLFAIGGNGLQIGDLVPVTHPDGTGVGGWIAALLQVRGISTNFDDYSVTLALRALNPTGVNDDMVLTWFFGGSLISPVSNAAYPSGSTGDKFAPSTDTLKVDSAKLQGTYLFEADGYVDAGVTLTLALVNVDDAPNTPIAEITITNTTSGYAVSATVLAPGVGLASPGVEKNYRIKQKASGASGGTAGYFCAARLKKAS